MEMDSLISFLSITLQALNAPIVHDVRDIAFQYFGTFESLTIIADENCKWDIFEFPVSTKIMNLGVNFRDIEPTAAVILHTTEPNITHKLSDWLSWNCDTKFLILSENGCTNDLVTNLWQSNACKLLVLNINFDVIEICRDLHKLCPHDTPALSPIKYNRDREISKYVLQPNLNNCTLNVSYMNIAPYVLFDGETMGGNEGEIVTMALKNLGVNMKFINRQLTNWGTYDPPSGLIGDVVTGNSFIGVGGLYPFTERFVKANAVQFCLPVHIGFVVPKGAGPYTPSYLIILISEFSFIVWVATFVTYFLLLPVVAGFEKLLGVIRGNDYNFGINWPLKIYQMTLGVPTTEMTSKAMMLTCIWYGFLLTTMYKSLMSSKLTAPSKIPEITTIQGVRDSKIVPTGPVNTWIIMKSYGEDNPYLKTLSDHYVANATDTYQLVKTLVRGRNSALFRHTLHVIYTTLSDPELTDQIHVLEEKTAEFFSLSLMKKGTCFKHQINRKFAQICEGGFVSKSLKDASNTRASSSALGPRKLTIHDIEGFLYLTALGWGISLLAISAEFIVFYFKKMLAPSSALIVVKGKY